MNKQKINYYELIKETTILTIAIAIIASAVYLFLVPSQTSISSISGLAIIIIDDYNDFKYCFIDYWIYFMWQRIWD